MWFDLYTYGVKCAISPTTTRDLYLCTSFFFLVKKPGVLLSNCIKTGRNQFWIKNKLFCPMENKCSALKTVWISAHFLKFTFNRLNYREFETVGAKCSMEGASGQGVPIVLRPSKSVGDKSDVKIFCGWFCPGQTSLDWKSFVFLKAKELNFLTFPACF